MNNDELIKKLEQLELPEIELSSHRRQLKTTLLNSAQKRTSMTYSFNFLAPVGAVAVAIVIAIGVTYTSGTPHTYAADLVAKSMEAVSQLSDVQKNALDVHLRSEADSLLVEATKAKDLTVLSPDQVTGEMYPSSWMDTLSADERANFAAKLASADLKGARFLQFTDSNGQNVIIAVNQNNLPIYQVSNAGTKNADEAAGVQALVENFGEQLKFVSLLSPTAASDMATRYKDYVVPELLSKWEADPMHAYGRLTSSPWPNSILVTDVEKTAAGDYTVKGQVLEETSAELVQNAANAELVTFTVSNIDGHWLITAASAQPE